MKIESVHIENLRSFKSETIYFNNYTCLVGQNGSGKSTVLCALNIFFRNSEGMSSDPECLDLNQA
jgi:putative ATP-dependent endonuclease of the OLD family